MFATNLHNLIYLPGLPIVCALIIYIVEIIIYTIKINKGRK